MEVGLQVRGAQQQRDGPALGAHLIVEDLGRHFGSASVRHRRRPAAQLRCERPCNNGLGLEAVTSPAHRARRLMHPTRRGATRTFADEDKSITVLSCTNCCFRSAECGAGSGRGISPAERKEAGRDAAGARLTRTAGEGYSRGGEIRRDGNVRVVNMVGGIVGSCWSQNIYGVCNIKDHSQ